MSELQNESVEAPVINESQFDTDLTGEQEAENLETGAELATDSGDQHEESGRADVDKEAVNKVINKKHFEAKQAQREAEEYKRKFEELQASQQVTPQKSAVPPMPDAFDDDYDTKIANRDRVLIQNAQIEAANQYQSNVEQQAQQQRLAQQQQDFMSKAEKYSNRASELGVSKEELKTTGELLVNYGTNDVLADAILSDDQGPLISRYLASNPMELDKLNNSVLSNPILAGAVFNEVKAKAANLKPKTTNTPAPAARVDGGAVNNEAGNHPHVRGDFE